MADIEKLTVTLAANIEAYNADLERAAKYTQQQTAKMEQTFAKLATFGSRSQQSLDKLASGMSSVGKTSLASQVETELLNASLKGTGEAAVEVSHAIGAMSTQGMAAFHALRGGTEMLAQGVDPMRVLAMEMNNLTYAASGAGGLKGAFLEAIGVFKGMLNPVAVLTTGLIGAGLAVVGLGSSFARSQSKIDLALTGVGQSAGMTVGKINQIGEAVSKAGELSTSEATDVATAIASTGRASVESAEKATALAHAYSLVFGKDLTKSAQDLAQVIADPGNAIDGLNQKLGAWSANQVELVKNLALSGNRQQAAKIIIDGMRQSIGDAADKTDFWTRSWNKLTKAISEAVTASGKDINKAVGVQTTEEKMADALAAAKARVQGLATSKGARGGQAFGNAQEIAEALADVNRLQAAFDKLEKTKTDTRNAVEVSDIIKGIDPTLQRLDDLQALITKIKNAPLADKNSEPLRDSIVRSLQNERDALAANVALSKEQTGVISEQYELNRKSTALDIQALNARTPLQKAQIAYQKTYNDFINQRVDPTIAKAEAQLSYTKELAAAQHQLSEAQRDRIYQNNQSVQSAQVETDSIGLSIGAATTLTQRFQLLAAARAEAHKNGMVVSPEEIKAANDAADALGRLAQAQATINLRANTDFDISQIGRSQSEQNVYGALNSAGLLDNGQIISQEAKLNAELLRTKEALLQIADVEKSFASDFLHDLIQGKSAVEALGDALTNVANKLLDMGINNLLAVGNKSFLDNFTGLGFSGVTLARGGFVAGPGSGTSDSIPAQLSNGEYVINAAATKKHRALLEAINTGTVGKFATGGPVRMPNVSIPTPVHASPAQSITIAPQILLQNGTKEGVLAAKNDFGPELDKRMRAIVLETLDRKATARRILR